MKKLIIVFSSILLFTWCTKKVNNVTAPGGAAIMQLQNGRKINFLVIPGSESGLNPETAIKIVIQGDTLCASRELGYLTDVAVMVDKNDEYGVYAANCEGGPLVREGKFVSITNINKVN